MSRWSESDDAANSVVGKTLIKWELSPDRETLIMHFEGGETLTGDCEGDCCSHTWIESIETPTLPSVIRKIENIEMPEGRPIAHPGFYGEVMAYYGVRITLDSGHMIIDYRNSSNGHYGGDLRWHK